MVDVVGVEHVCTGTDQQVAAPGSVQDYAQWVHLVAAMLRGGFTPDEAGNTDMPNADAVESTRGRATRVVRVVEGLLTEH